MIDDRTNWRMTARRVALALTAAAFPVACLNGPAVHAQAFMRSPSINIESRLPSINPTVAPRINPNIAGRVVTGAGRTMPRIGATTLRSASQIGVRSLPFVHYSPNLYPACSYAYRDSDGECLDQPVTSADGGGGG